jgi:hypothetical protein
MRLLRIVRLSLTATCAIAVCLLAGKPSLTAADDAVAARVERDYGALPLSFEPNRGQTDRRVRFLARGDGFALFLTKREAMLSLSGRAVLRMRALGANPDPQLVGERRLPGRVNYLLGRDHRHWRTGLATYGGVRYRDIYPGIDQVFYGKRGRLEYDFVVAPTADPGSIALAFTGVKRVELGPHGEIVLAVRGGTIRQPRPYAYQEEGGTRRRVAARYVLRDGAIRFALGVYDRSRPLVIDPVIQYSTYLGGNRAHPGEGIAVEAGEAYVTGSAHPANFPTPGNALGPVDGRDVFVAKLNATGSALEYMTYLGGSSTEWAGDIDVDARGRAYVVGTTNSNDFPTTEGAFQAADPDPAGAAPDPANANANFDAFVVKLGSDGTYLKYGTYLGGHGSDSAAGIAVDVDERAHVTGGTASADFPTTPGAFQSSDPDTPPRPDAFVTKLSSEGTYLKYSTYVGGHSDDFGNDIAVDASRRAYVIGTTASADFPTTTGAFQRVFHGWSDVFVLKLSSEGTALKYSTYLGGNRNDDAAAIAVDASERAYVAGETRSANFPTTPGAFQSTDPDIVSEVGGDGFVAKLSSEGTSLKYSTYLGGRDLDRVHGIDIDMDGRVHAAGHTWSADFPVTPDAQFRRVHSTGGGFITRFATDGSALRFSTFLPPRGYAMGVAVDEAGDFYATGAAWGDGFPSPYDLPSTPGAFRTFGGWYDGFVTKFDN